MKIKIIYLGFFLLLVTSSYSQSLNKPKLDSLFSSLEQNNKAMGSLAISKKGKVIYERSIGYAILSGDNKTKATLETKYRVGSISKVFTAVMIFQLIDEKKLSLETKLAAYYPAIPNADKITIAQLLSHHSGIHNVTERPDYLKWVQQPKTENQMIQEIIKGGTDFLPGLKSAYSNSNYILLGYIIEKITKVNYSENLKNKIVSKLALSGTYVGGKINPLKQESYSYEWLNHWSLIKEADLTSAGAAGCIVSTPKDLNVFLDGIFSLQLISKNSLMSMTKITDGFGMGLMEIPFYDKKGYGHTGGIDAFVSVFVHYPEDSLSVSYCSNGQAYPRNDILIGILSICYNKDYTIPSFMKHEVSLETLKTYFGVYSSKDLPLKITISQDSIGLRAQATGQPAFPLDALSDDLFKFEQANLTMGFKEEGKTLVLKQNGATYLFKKEE